MHPLSHPWHPASVITLLSLAAARLTAGTIPVTDAQVLRGLSPCNWVVTAGAISATANGASLTVAFKGTRQVSLNVATSHLSTRVATRYPIIAWSVNGGPAQFHQLSADADSVALAVDRVDPKIELYLKGTSPFENRYEGDVPANSLKITGFTIADGGATVPAELPEKIWLTMGDSILSGDGAAYAAGQGRPPDDAWAASEDGRASYGYLLAQHFGYREGRIAYGGYNWGGGMAGLPALTTLIDQKTSTISRLSHDALEPAPEVVLINLGENGAPQTGSVTDALTQLRHRLRPAARIIVMVPVSGRGRAEITQAFKDYQQSSGDKNASLVDAGSLNFATCDGQHPTAAGHQAIFQAALPAFEALLGPVANHPPVK